MMVHWSFVLAALIVGALVGVFITACLVAGKDPPDTWHGKS